jgi:uncharacterized protein (TIGR00266 family)
MDSTVKGTDAFRYMEFTLLPGESLIAESGAMASMSAELNMKARFNGGLFKGLLRKYLGSESLFINEFHNPTDKPLTLTLTSQCPGDVRALQLDNESWCLEGGSYICATPGVTLGIRWAGIASFIGGEGLFKLVVSGTGTVWFGGYGAFIEKDIQGEYIVDSGHLVAYQPQIRLKTQLSSGIFGSLFSGEGFVTRLEGSGKVWLQTRSLSGLADWINPRF